MPLFSLHFGRHFWLDEENELCSCPTFTNGTPDYSQEGYVSEWTELEDVDLSKLFAVHRSLVITDVFHKDVRDSYVKS
mgnify:CR=1